MTLKDARALRDVIRQTGAHCTVPFGWGPDRYFAQIWPGAQALRLHSEADWTAYCEQRDAARRKRVRRPRSPIEAMIDQAAGLTDSDYE